MHIRDYIRSDAERVRDLIVRTGFGADASDALKTPATIHETLMERCARCVLVAEEEDGRIVGMLAMLRDSGRRSSPPDELYSDLYLIDPHHRNGLVGGKLFDIAFRRVLAMGVRVLRTEASPVNPAFALYARAGFRCKPGSLPDQRGYVDLVSWLPGVVLDMMSVDVRYRDAPPGMHALRGTRGAGASSGVEWVDGRWSARYEVRLGDSPSYIVVDLDTGEVLEAGATLPVRLPRPGNGAVVPPRTAELWRADFEDGAWTVTVDDEGTLRIEDGGSPVLLERWPVVRHVDPPGWRNTTPARQADAIPLQPGSPRVIAHQHLDGVRLAGTADGIERTCTVRGNELEVRTSSDRAVICSPWTRLRGSVWHLHSGGRWYSGPTRQGVWPPSAADFQPAVRRPFDDARNEHIDAVAVSAGGRTLVARWDGADARFEALHLPQLLVPAGREATWTVSASERDLATEPCAESAPGVNEISPKDSVQPPDQDVVRPVDWSAPDNRGARVCESGPHRLTMASSSALATWLCGGRSILTSPWPRSRALGPLVDWHAGLWVVEVPDRNDPNHGVVWAGPDRSLPYQQDGPGWSVSLGQEGMLRVRATADSGGDGDVAVCLTPSVAKGSRFMVLANGRLWELSEAARSWEGGVSAVALMLAPDQYLVVAPWPQGRRSDTEVFIRFGHGPVLLTCLGRARRPFTVDLQVHPAASVLSVLGCRPGSCERIR